MEKINYFGLILGRYQSLPRRYGTDTLLYSSEAELIAAIGANEPVTATELAKMKISTPSAISQIVKKLDSKNLLIKDTLEGNRKNIYLRLSEDGREIYEYYRAEQDEKYARYKNKLPSCTCEDLAKSARLINFLTEEYLDELRSLDM